MGPNTDPLPVTYVVEVDYELKTVKFMGNDYPIAHLDSDLIAAGDVLRDATMSSYQINMNRVTGNRSIARTASQLLFRGECKVATQRF